MDKDMALAASGTGPAPSGLSRDSSQAKPLVPSAWEFDFEAPARTRILGRGFSGINVGWADPVPDGEVMWFCDDGKWRTDDDRKRDGFRGGSSSAAPCGSFKAFRSHLRRHPELRGRRVRLVSRWVGNDVWAIPASGIETATAGETQGEGSDNA